MGFFVGEDCFFLWILQEQRLGKNVGICGNHLYSCKMGLVTHSSWDN